MRFFRRFKKNNNTAIKEVEKGVLTDNPFNIISNSDILTGEDWNILLPLTSELQETFKKAQVFRTRTEMDVSVLNDIKYPTHASKYWQSVREQNVMFGELVMLSYNYRKNLVEIKKLCKQQKSEKDELENELLQIEIEKKMFTSKNQEKTAKDRIREIKAWSDIKDREAGFMSEEELVDVDTHQLIGYTKRWINQSLIAGDNGSPAENQNLQGQLISGLRACKNNDLLESILEGYSKEVQKLIKELA